MKLTVFMFVYSFDYILTHYESITVTCAILSSNFSDFGFKFNTGFTSQFTTYHLPLAEENDC